MTSLRLWTDDNAVGKRASAEQREKLGVAKGRGSKTPPPEPTNALQKVDVRVLCCI